MAPHRRCQFLGEKWVKSSLTFLLNFFLVFIFSADTFKNKQKSFLKKPALNPPIDSTPTTKVGFTCLCLGLQDKNRVNVGLCRSSCKKIDLTLPFTGYPICQPCHRWHRGRRWTYRQAHLEGRPCLPQIQGEEELLAQGAWCGHEPRRASPRWW